MDTELVRRGLVESRTAAAEAISAGLVRVGGAVADKASRLVAARESLAIDGPATRFVGRGGEKLQAALDEWPK
ncbi:MAG: S4 domain-containing protein, partial [Actinomycetota bacterium]|nr:S4 domain-containing protein [Actinomycetota bacterium]